MVNNDRPVKIRVVAILMLPKDEQFRDIEDRNQGPT